MFKAKNQSRYFWIEHWKALLEGCQILGKNGLSALDARLLFAWSQGVVKDELRRRQRAVSLMYFDFVEVSPPLLTARPSLVPAEMLGDSFLSSLESQCKNRGWCRPSAEWQTR